MTQFQATNFTVAVWLSPTSQELVSSVSATDAWLRTTAVSPDAASILDDLAKRLVSSALKAYSEVNPISALPRGKSIVSLSLSSDYPGLLSLALRTGSPISTASSMTSDASTSLLMEMLRDGSSETDWHPASEQ